MKIAVECYAGHKGGERPLRFRLGERWIAVQEIADRWYDPEASLFRVRGEDDAIYILRHDQRLDEWTLVSYRRQEL